MSPTTSGWVFQARKKKGAAAGGSGEDHGARVHDVNEFSLHVVPGPHNQNAIDPSSPQGIITCVLFATCPSALVVLFDTRELVLVPQTRSFFLYMTCRDTPGTWPHLPLLDMNQRRDKTGRTENRALNRGTPRAGVGTDSC